MLMDPVGFCGEAKLDARRPVDVFDASIREREGAEAVLDDLVAWAEVRLAWGRDVLLDGLVADVRCAGLLDEVHVR